VTKVHLVTGATGFVGGALTLELLDRTDDRVICLVRAGCADQAQARLEASLAAAARSYDRENLLGEIPRRCRAIPGDILHPVCGLGPGEPVAEVWHCAASLKYEDDQAEEIFQHNVEGTRHVLALARVRGAAVFNYVSTAYVAGNRTGRILEEPPHGEGVSNNRYEQSKIRAEALVAAAEGMHLRILRPSIVIGHSRTYEAMSCTGMYSFIQKTSRFQRTVARRLGHFLGHRALRIRAEAGTEINYIPVDAVAANAVAISRSNTSAQVFHLTNASPCFVGQGLNLLFQVLGLRAPRFVTSPRELTSIDEALDREITFFSSYFLNSKGFDRTNTDAVLGSAASRWPIPDETFLAHVGWYLNTHTKGRQARHPRGAAKGQPQPVG
jgi:thioester reductase-like protein